MLCVNALQLSDYSIDHATQLNCYYLNLTQRHTSMSQAVAVIRNSQLQHKMSIVLYAAIYQNSTECFSEIPCEVQLITQ